MKENRRKPKTDVQVMKNIAKQEDRPFGKEIACNLNFLFSRKQEF